MKKAYLLLTVLICSLLAACNDDPVITFFDHSGTYSYNGNMSLTATVNGFSVTDTGSGVVFKSTDNRIATVTIDRIIPNYGSVTIGNVEVTAAPDGNGILFEGRMALSETEVLVFEGSIKGTDMTISINIVPIPAPAQP